MKKVSILLFIILILAVLGMVLFFLSEKEHNRSTKYPFFISTKYSTTNVRSGPGEEFPIIRVYKEKHIPFKVVASYKNWYQIQDYTGKVGWLFKNVTGQVKTAITIEKVEIYKSSDNSSKKVATIDSNIVVMVRKVQGNYVQVYLNVSNISVKGWVEKSKLWGID